MHDAAAHGAGEKANILWSVKHVCCCCNRLSVSLSVCLSVILQCLWILQLSILHVVDCRMLMLLLLLLLLLRSDSRLLSLLRV